MEGFFSRLVKKVTHVEKKVNKESEEKAAIERSEEKSKMHPGGETTDVEDQQRGESSGQPGEATDGRTQPSGNTGPETGQTPGNANQQSLAGAGAGAGAAADEPPNNELQNPTDSKTATGGFVAESGGNADSQSSDGASLPSDAADGTSVEHAQYPIPAVPPNDHHENSLTGPPIQEQQHSTTNGATGQPIEEQGPTTSTGVGDSTTNGTTGQQMETASENYEDYLVSEKIHENRFLQDKITSSLDHTSHRVIKCWEHLACTKEINAPLAVRLKCKLSAPCSFTMMVLEAVAARNKTVKDLMDALSAMERNYVKKVITDVYPDAANSSQRLSKFVSNTANNNLLTEMATHLDQKSRVNKYWLHLGYQFKLTSETLKEIEYGQYTQVVMEYLYDQKPSFSIGKFYDVVKRLERDDVLEELDPFIKEEGDRNKPMRDVIELDSDTMRGICVCLNNPNIGLKNWRHLAKSPELGIPEDVIKGCTPEKPKSPTEALLEWIYCEKPNLTVGELCRALQRIDRNDIVKDIKEFFQQQPTPDQQHPN